VIRTVVGLGANLGDPLTAMRAAVARLGEVAVVRKTSSVYRTAPVGGPPQPDYLNAAVLLEYGGEPGALLSELLAIEARMGRVRGERNGPRTLDLDVLWIEGVAIESAALTVPHPRLRERAFAMVPMLEVVPDAVDPRTGEGYVAPPGDVARLAEPL
jgi:2-amino-4-hydroxy-6-hydroxymethyldihydropteridine diphosphokinase